MSPLADLDGLSHADLKSLATTATTIFTDMQATTSSMAAAGLTSCSARRATT
jgi:hypothetical protein